MAVRTFSRNVFHSRIRKFKNLSMSFQRNVILRSAERTKKEIKENESKLMQIRNQKEAKAFEYATRHILQIFYADKDKIMTKEDVWEKFSYRLNRDESDERMETEAIINESKISDILTALSENRYLVPLFNKATRVYAYQYCF